jgi:hypothetical protein
MSQQQQQQQLPVHIKQEEEHEQESSAQYGAAADSRIRYMQPSVMYRTGISSRSPYTYRCCSSWYRTGHHRGDSWSSSWHGIVQTCALCRIRSSSSSSTLTM